MLIFTPILVLSVIIAATSGQQRRPENACPGEGGPVDSIEMCKWWEDKQCRAQPAIRKACPLRCKVKVDCQAPWTCVSGRCLQVINEPYQTWSQARVTCHHKANGADADLAVVSNDPEELKALGEFIRLNTPTNNGFWLGGSDLNEDGVYSWINSDAIKGYTGSGPNNADECIYINILGDVDVLANEGCGATLDFVCQKNA